MSYCYKSKQINYLICTGKVISKQIIIQIYYLFMSNTYSRAPTSELFGVSISDAIICLKSKRNCSNFGHSTKLGSFRNKKKIVYKMV